ncbi:hypothetical protein CANTEDRAFT_113942 [Yamadazyma tenuis ATCC 10573]|uniref:Uncharacterized protein n=1 Tax=Candida tenuis (strain ATCC 10573 / BCRC 21748 / CBS 615 / JCM 9827 / NBRC 10315 / NRRL Y-1498 / VKM Y-70) TaxID=590646 RepID=G3B417_CANTC|nr:uncharacterized protein CANTEDRAFT_113942 [Yamadazyma tenuis ATCC 10573]EGV63914.1 hypothetical protein CANTEDRAFT_113942 [Yamadazyma tenuis ATCC 10573]
MGFSISKVIAAGYLLLKMIGDFVHISPLAWVLTDISACSMHLMVDGKKAYTTIIDSVKIGQWNDN